MSKRNQNFEQNENEDWSDYRKGHDDHKDKRERRQKRDDKRNWGQDEGNSFEPTPKKPKFR